MENGRIFILLVVLLALTGCGAKPASETEKSSEYYYKIQEGKPMETCAFSDVYDTEDLPEEFRYAQIYCDTKGNLYAYKAGDSDYVQLNQEHDVTGKGTVDGEIVGFVENPVTGDLAWYGRRDGEVVTCNLEKGTSVSGQLPQINAYEKYLMTYDETGNLYIVTLHELWQIGEEPKLVCNLEQRGYVLSDLFHFTGDQYGKLILMTRMDGEDILLTMIPQLGEEEPRKEIILAAEDGNVVLVRTAARFNRTNENYYVTIVTPGGKELEDYRKQLQLELSAGKGPDLISGQFLLPAEPYVKAGYLECLTGLIDENEFVPGVIEGVSFGGELYGAPYEFMLYLRAMSQNLLGEKVSFSLTELMNAVRLSDAEILESGADGSYIIYYYGLSDRKNDTYIDWEKGVSHLTEPPFLELLQFASEFQDVQNNYEMRGKMAQQGKIAIVLQYMSTLWDMQYLTECFQGKEAYVGLPSVDGMYSGVYAKAVYMSHFSKVQDGGREFLQFLLSKEMQGDIVEWNVYKEGAFSGNLPQLPTRWNILRTKLQRDREHVPTATHMSGGLIYIDQEISEEKLGLLLDAIKGARPIDIGDNELFRMVSEELAPFFTGDKTAEEAAEILHNRVQNMLDER